MSNKHKLKHRFDNSMKLIAGRGGTSDGRLTGLAAQRKLCGWSGKSQSKSATCGCCGKWIEHMQDAGFKVTAHNRQDMNQIRRSMA